MNSSIRITNIDAVRSVLKNRYNKDQTTTPFLQAMKLALQKETRDPSAFSLPEYSGFLSCDEFWEYVGSMPIPRAERSSHFDGEENKNVPKGFGNFYLREDNLFSEGMDVNIYTHLPFVNDGFHTHDHFELNYIYRGKGDFYFEEEHLTLDTGSLLIIAPDSPHNVRALENDFIISIMVRKSTFDKIFWSLLSKDTLVSAFFRNSLNQNNERNYVLLKTDNNRILQSYIQQLMVERDKQDAFVNNNMVCILLLFISTVLRKFSETASFYNISDISTERFDVNLVSQYIRQNYTTVTLKELANKFHYSEAFFSKLFKKHFGKSFSDLIREFKLASAKQLLQYSNCTIKEVCEIVGYNSISAFSRAYKEHYGVSPRSHSAKEK